MKIGAKIILLLLGTVLTALWDANLTLTKETMMQDFGGFGGTDFIPNPAGPTIKIEHHVDMQGAPGILVIKVSVKRTTWEHADAEPTVTEEDLCEHRITWSEQFTLMLSNMGCHKCREYLSPLNVDARFITAEEIANGAEVPEGVVFEHTDEGPVVIDRDDHESVFPHHLLDDLSI